MTLFKEQNFKGKYHILKSWKHKIIKLVLKEFPKINTSELNLYLDCLLEECHYNRETNTFYEPISHYKFTVKIFTQITIEYIEEHPDEF